MWKKYRTLAGTAFVAALIFGAPLWIDGSHRFESLMPTAAAAVILPAAQNSVAGVTSERFESARLLMGGTVLFALAGVVRRAI